MAKKKVKDHVSPKGHTEHHAHKSASEQKIKNKAPWYNSIIIWQVAALVLLIVVIGFVVMGWSGKASEPVSGTGKGTGKITILEFSDFNCPACNQAQPTIKQLKEIYGDSVTWEIRQFAFQGPTSTAAAAATECARDQGKEVAYKDNLYANFRQYSDAQLKQYAVQLGLDAAQFNECLDSGIKTAVVEQHMAEGRSLGVSATPTFIVNGEKIQGALPVAEFRTVIDKQLGSGETTTGSVVPVSDDPEIEFIVLSDSSCTVCGEQDIIDVTQQQLFPTVTTRKVEYTSEEGQALIEELGITVVPAYIFDTAVTQAQNFNQVSSALVQVGEYYYINPAALGTGRVLAPIEVTGRPTLGKLDAPVTIIEWSDFTCPFCKRHHEQTHKALVEEFVNTGQAKIVRLHLTWSQEPRATNSKIAALASECAFEQNEFWAFHDGLYEETSTSYDKEAVVRIATSLGLDVPTFTACLDSEKYAENIASDMALAQQYGVGGTPGFIINGVMLMGAYPLDQFQQIINAELN